MRWTRTLSVVVPGAAATEVFAEDIATLWRAAGCAGPAECFVRSAVDVSSACGAVAADVDAAWAHSGRARADVAAGITGWDTFVPVELKDAALRPAKLAVTSVTALSDRELSVTVAAAAVCAYSVSRRCAACPPPRGLRCVSRCRGVVVSWYADTLLDAVCSAVCISGVRCAGAVVGQRAVCAARDRGCRHVHSRRASDPGPAAGHAHRKHSPPVARRGRGEVGRDSHCLRGRITRICLEKCQA